MNRVICVIMAMALFLFNVSGAQIVTKSNTDDQIKNELLDLMKKAERGEPESQYQLGLSYLVRGDGVEAHKWFRKAAEQEYAPAQNHLGLQFANGLDMERDCNEASKWMRKAAHQDYVLAQDNLGVWYMDGICVERDYKEAITWFRKAAEKGLCSAQLHLGMIYEEGGNGIDQNYMESAKWYNKAAIQGDWIAQSSLGKMYAYGRGVDQNDIEAYKWVLIEEMPSGIEVSPDLKRLLLDRMTKEQIFLAQQKAKEFAESKEKNNTGQ